MHNGLIICTILILTLCQPLTACRMLALQALPQHELGGYSEAGALDPLLLETLEAFRLQGGSGDWPYNNTDGWALGAFHQSSSHPWINVTRSAVQAFTDDQFYPQVYDLLDTNGIQVLLGHLRQTSSGADGIANPHPFVFTAGDGTTYSFAHNGDLTKSVLLDMIDPAWFELHPPQTFGGGAWDGEGWSNVIDSELFFFWILQNIESENDIISGLMTALSLLEQRLPNQVKNFIFSDGSDIYAYRRSPSADIYYYDIPDTGEIPWYLEACSQRAIMSTPPVSGMISLAPWTELEDYQLLVFHADGSSSMFMVDHAQQLSDEVTAPQTHSLHKAFPNPFNQSTTIRFELPQPGQLTFEIYDFQGNLVYHLTDWSPGKGTISWNGLDLEGKLLPSGPYFYHLNQSVFRLSGKVLLLK